MLFIEGVELNERSFRKLEKLVFNDSLELIKLLKIFILLLLLFMFSKFGVEEFVIKIGEDKEPEENDMVFNGFGNISVLKFSNIM